MTCLSCECERRKVCFRKITVLSKNYFKYLTMLKYSSLHPFIASVGHSSPTRLCQDFLSLLSPAPPSVCSPYFRFAVLESLLGDTNVNYSRLIVAFSASCHFSSTRRASFHLGWLKYSFLFFRLGVVEWVY